MIEENIIRIVLLILFGLVFLSIISIFITLIFYVPYLVKITEKEDPELYTKVGPDRLFTSHMLHRLVYTLTNLYPYSYSKTVRFHSKIIRLTLVYPMYYLIISISTLFLLEILEIDVSHYISLINSKSN